MCALGNVPLGLSMPFKAVRQNLINAFYAQHRCRRHRRCHLSSAKRCGTKKLLPTFQRRKINRSHCASQNLWQLLSSQNSTAFCCAALESNFKIKPSAALQLSKCCMTRSNLHVTTIPSHPRCNRRRRSRPKTPLAKKEEKEKETTNKSSRLTTICSCPTQFSLRKLHHMPHAVSAAPQTVRHNFFVCRQAL